MTGEITTQRTALNVSGKNQKFDVKIKQPAGVTITSADKQQGAQVNEGASLTFPITISAPAVANGQYFGRITLIPTERRQARDDPGRVRPASRAPSADARRALRRRSSSTRASATAR